MNDDEIAYFIMRWKTRGLVLSTAPKTWDNTDKDSKNRIRYGPISRGSQGPGQLAAYRRRHGDFQDPLTSGVRRSVSKAGRHTIYEDRVIAVGLRIRPFVHSS